MRSMTWLCAARVQGSYGNAILRTMSLTDVESKSTETVALRDSGLKECILSGLLSVHGKKVLILASTELCGRIRRRLV